MKFKVEHLFKQITLADYEKLYFNEAFNVALCKGVALGRELLKFENHEGMFAREVRVSPERALPESVVKILGADKISYTEFLSYQLGTYKGVFETIPGLLKDKIESSGTFSFAQKPDGVLRTVEGEVKVKIFGLGGVVERLIVGDVEKSYQAAADFTQAWINRLSSAGAA
jgi:hypothetical protein